MSALLFGIFYVVRVFFDLLLPVCADFVFGECLLSPKANYESPKNHSFAAGFG